MTSTTPLLPSLTGTPTNRSLIPYSPSSSAVQGRYRVLVEEDSLDHLNDGSGRRVVGASGLQIINDFGAAITRALHDLLEASGFDEIGDRYASHRRAADYGNHSVTVSAEDIRLD